MRTLLSITSKLLVRCPGSVNRVSATRFLPARVQRTVLPYRGQHLLARPRRTGHDQAVHAEVGEAAHGVDIEPAARRDAHLERSERPRTRDLAAGSGQPVDAGAGPVHVE